MTPEEITTPIGDDDVFAALLKKTSSAPSVAPLPSGLSERIAAATYARPTLWSKLALVLTPAPARFALGGALTAAALCAVFLPRLSPTQVTRVAIVKIDTPVPSPTPEADTEPEIVKADVLPSPRPEVVTIARSMATPAPLAKVTSKRAMPPVPPSLSPNPTPLPERVLPSASTLKDDASIALETSKHEGEVAPGRGNPEPITRVGESAVAAATRTGEKLATETLPTPTLVSAQPVTLVARQSSEEAGILDETGTLRTRPNRVKFNLGLSDRERAAMHKSSQIDPLTANNSEPNATGTGLAFVRADVK